MQQVAIARAAKARGMCVTRWYFEAMSGRSRNRPELDLLLEDARRGEFRQLWVFKLDRLTRSGIRDTLNLLEELKACGCQVISVADGFALDGPWAEVILAVIAWAAQMERAAIGDRISAARTARGTKGLGWGRPTRLSLEQTEEIRKRAVLEGQSIRMISMCLHIPKSVVGRFVQTLKEPEE